MVHSVHIRSLTKWNLVISIALAKEHKLHGGYLIFKDNFYKMFPTHNVQSPEFFLFHVKFIVTVDQIAENFNVLSMSIHL